MDSIIQRKRARLARQQAKIAEMQALAAEIEKEIQAAEDEQLGYLARSVANNLSGGMEELFEILRGLRAKPANMPQAASLLDSNEYKEGEIVEETDKTGTAG